MKKFNRSIASAILIAFALVCFTAQIIAVNVISNGNPAVRTVLIVGDTTIIIAMAAYFFYSLSKTRKRRAENERRLKRSKSLYEIQQFLLEAYGAPELVNKALRKTAETVGAEALILLSMDKGSAGDLYLWKRDDCRLSENITLNNFVEEQPEVFAQLQQGKTVALEESREFDMSSVNIKNMVVVPVMDKERSLVGILSAANFDKLSKEKEEFLESVSRDFMLALHGISSYRIIEEIGSVCSLTGLHNRNNYQKALLDYARFTKGTICCVYIDANGLHELNNSLGHGAGDAMLRFIGTSMKQFFGSSHTFRIGGDEFTAFLMDENVEEIEKLISAFSKQIDENGYSVSVGYSIRHCPAEIPGLIADAEKGMYESKRRYYSENKNLTKAREMNTKLEKMLIEKRDSENFISIISSYFLGVCVVDLTTDNCRPVYIADHFKKNLEETNWKFSKAMRLREDAYVIPEDREKFLALFDYEKTDKAICRDGMLETIYRCPNGETILVRVYKSESYSETAKESFWIIGRYGSIERMVSNK